MTTPPRLSRRTLAARLCIAAAPLLGHTGASAQAVPSGEPAGAPAANTQRIEVTGARFREQAGKTSLSGDDLARQPGTSGDPMRGIQSLPGVTSIDDASSEPAVRGSRPGDNAYYVDFLPVGYLFHTGGLASVFNPALIRRFSMASAAWGPEYGNVVGAVFDVELRRPRTDRLGGQADFSLLGGSLLAEGPLGEGLSFFVAGRRSWFDLVSKSGEDKEEGVRFQTPVYSDSQSRLLWQLSPRQRLRFDIATAADRVEYSLSPGGKAAARDPILVGNSTERQSFATGAVVWEYEPEDTLAHRVAAGRMLQDTTLRLGGAGSVKLKITTDYVRQQLEIARWAGHEVTVGTSIESRLIDVALDFNFPRCTEFDPDCDIGTAPRLRTDQRARQNTFAVHLADRWQFAPGWAATAGLRASREAYIGRNALEPRVALEYSPDKNHTWSAAAGRHSQPPAGEESLAVVGNPRLKPISSDHFALGYTRLLGDGWSWRVEAYAKRFDNYAVADPMLNYRNGARGTASGGELLVKKDPSSGSKLSGFASVTLSRARRTVNATGATFPFDYDQPVVLTVVGQYRWTERWLFGAKWRYNSGSPTTPVVGTGLYPDGRVRPLYGPINSQRLPAYHRLDLRADYRFGPRATGYIELINAYNRRNVAGYSYSADYKTREELRQLPILPSFGFTYAY